MNYVVDMDANTSLRYSHEDVSNVVGPGASQPRASHQQSWSTWICEWCQALGIRASNTFDCLGVSDLWTCGTWRACRNRSQIDFVFLSHHLKGSTRPHTFNHLLFARSDHRPLLGEIEIPGRVSSRSRAAASRVGWQPHDMEDFRQGALRLMGAPELDVFQAGLVEVVAFGLTV